MMAQGFRSSYPAEWRKKPARFSAPIIFMKTPSSSEKSRVSFFMAPPNECCRGNVVSLGEAGFNGEVDRGDMGIEGSLSGVMKTWMSQLTPALRNFMQ